MDGQWEHASKQLLDHVFLFFLGQLPLLRDFRFSFGFVFGYGYGLSIESPTGKEGVCEVEQFSEIEGLCPWPLTGSVVD